MIGIFAEKHGDAAGSGSATRVITFCMALAYDAGLVFAAKTGHFHELGVWVVLLGVILNLAVPIQGWLRTKGGHESLAKAVDFIAAKLGAKAQP